MDRSDLLLWLALQEDLGHGDVTTEAVVDPESLGRLLSSGESRLCSPVRNRFEKFSV